MRDLHRNKREIYYSTPMGTEPILDEWGNDTLEVKTIYSSPTLLKCNVSANVGQEAAKVFGAQTDYTRTISLSGTCPLVEGSRVWFGKPITGSYNYLVVKVADSKNAYLVALREVVGLG